MRKLILLIIVLLPICSFAQVVDDFGDGDFTANPAWVGDNGDFTVTSQELQLNNNIASDSHLMTVSTLIDNTTWEFLFRWEGFSSTGLSSSNEVFFYLTANQNIAPETTSNTEGYFVRIGNTQDEISLYRQDTDISTSNLNEIIDGNANSFGSVTASSSGSIRIKVTRDAVGLWLLSADITGGTNFMEVGSTTDATYTSSSFTGIFIDYSMGNSDGYFFDDISISAPPSAIAVSSVSVESSTSIRVTFNQEVDQTSAELSANYAIDNSITVTSALRDNTNLEEVVLTVSTLATDNYQLTVSNVEDDATNTDLAAPESENFSYTQLALQSLVTNSATEIQLTFNDNLDQSTAGNETIYSINNTIGIPTLATLDAGNNSIVTLTLPNSLQAATNYTLTYGTLNNSLLNSNITAGATQAFSFVTPILISGVTAISATEIEIEFNQEVDQTTAETITNYSLNSIGNPTQAVQNQSELNKVNLTFGTAMSDNTYTLTINNVEDVSSNSIAANSTKMFTYLPLAISSISTVSNTEIEIIFNQNVNQATAENATNYTANGELNIANGATLNGGDNTKVNITFSTVLVNNTYTLTINNVANATGNSTVSSLSESFSYSAASSFRSIVINEIFADPDPVVGLPAEEFVELYNTGSRTINIGGFNLSGGTIDDFTLAPNAYVIVTDDTDVALYTGLGDVVAMPSWNILTNGGESLILKDNLDNIVDSVSYASSWYGDGVKDDGGWTLEQINPDLICGGYEGNWTASNNTDGGTPGTQNSVFDNSADVSGPNVIAIKAVDDNTITLTFDEPMDETSLNNGIYAVDNGLTQTTVSPIVGLISVSIDLDGSLVSGTTYTVTITGVTDCSGNSIATNSISFDYDITPPTLDRIIIKSTTKIELHFDENLLESVAETESNYSVDNVIGNPSSAILSNDDNSIVNLTFATDFTLDLENILSLQNIEDVSRNALVGTVTQAFTLEQNIDTVLILGVNLLDVKFKVEVAQTAAETLTNYFVNEGAGNPVLATLDADNKTLVHLVFGIDLDENKNLILTVENQKNTSDEFITTPEHSFVYDTKAPELNLITVQSASQILLDFNEKVEQSSSEIINNYTYNNLFPTTATLQNNQSVLLTFSDDFEKETIFTLEISGIRDVFGNTLSKTIKEDFIYDIFPPQLDSLKVTSPTSLLLVYNENVEKVSSETNANYSLDNSVGNPISIIRNNEFNNQVTLEFGSTIPSVEELILEVNSISDIYSNTISTAVQITVDYSAFSIGKFRARSTTLLEITYNKTPNSTLASDIANYSVNGVSISQAQVDGSNDKTYLLTLSSPIADNSTNTLSLQNITSLTDIVIQQNEFVFDFKSQFNTVEIVSGNTLEIDFDVNLDATTAEILTNYTLSPTIGNPKVATLDEDKVRLVFNSDFENNIDYTISWTEIDNEFNNPLPDFSFVFSLDNIAPVASQSEVLFKNLLRLKFNENLDESSAEDESLYFVDNGIGNPSKSTYNDSDSTVLLEFETPFSESITYQINIDRVEDLIGNAVNNQKLSFTYIAPLLPQPGELLITEIMADPSPTNGLPEVEYVEIYNNSSNTFNLSTVVFSDNANSIGLENLDLLPNQYIIITSDPSGFDESVLTLEISNFPSLTNSGETISISNIDNVKLDEVTYQTSWYRDADKDNGGYSLERIFIAEQCLQEINWIASTHTNGGTPGAENSVFNVLFDTDAPQVSSLKISGTNQLIIYFDEILDSLSLENGTYEFDNGLVAQSITASKSGIDSVLITFPTDLTIGTLYQVTISNISDCSSNVIASTTQNFGIGKTPEYGDLLFTEVFPDPSPSIGLPSEEFIEIFNNSSSIINLDGIQLADASDTTSLPNYVIQPGEYLILSSMGSVSDFSPFGNTLGVISFPSLGNTSDQLLLFLADNTLIDRLKYTDDFYRDTDKDNGGYSLERIFIAEQCLQEINWIASTHTNGGTPGAENSVFNVLFDTDAPQVRSLKMSGTNQLIIYFDEILDSLSLENGTYEFDNGLVAQSITASKSGIDSVLITFSTDLIIGTLYQVTISNISDCSSNVIASTTQNFGIGKTPEYGDLLFTEVFPDPSPSIGLPSEEFIEIFNNSSSIINLDGIQLADASDTTSLPNYVIQPGEYLILSSLGSVSDFSPFGNTLGVTSFPSLGNTSDQLLLFLADNTLIDQLKYTDDFYRDTDKDNGGYSLERIFTAEQCLQEINWIASTNTSGGTPGAENSVFNVLFDTDAPEITALIIEADKAIRLLFNEPMDSLSLVLGTYILSNSLVVEGLEEVVKGSKEMLIKLAPRIEGGELYNISISDIEDCAGNKIVATNIDFGFGEKPSFNELIITEIMADPDPDAGSSVSLPSVEYLEIYNPTSKNIELSGLVLKDKSSETVLSSYLLFPNQYLLLVPNGGEELYPNIPVLPVKNWTSLSNGGETIAIFNEDELIFSITYDDDWYKDSDKNGGGYSLEMIDVTNPCGDINNWTASIDPKGGTPSLENSVTTSNPDNFGPQILEAIANSPTKVTITFDEKLNPNSIESGLFSISPAINISEYKTGNIEIKDIIITLSEPLEVKQNYTVTANGFLDCVGNLVREGNNTANLVLPETSEPLDIILNEVLFNPRSGGVDFVEVYNNSDKAINLNKWQLARFDNEGNLDAKTIVSTDLIILPATYKVFSTDSENIKGNYPAADQKTLVEVNTLPSMPNDEGTIIILDSLGNQIDLFDYNEDFHFNLIDDVDGVSLERINFSAETNNPNSWKSAGSAAGFATPGLLNSQFKTETQTSGTLTIEPKVFVPDNTGTNNFTTINYDLDNAGSFANILIYNHRGQLVKTIAQGDLLSTSGFYTWDGTSDTGQRASFGYYVIYFEIFDSSGNTSVMKETIVLGTRF